MPKLTLEQSLEALSRLRSASPSDVAAGLRTALASTSNHLVARAAILTRELQAESLADELASAFDRFMREPARTDKGCSAKQEIAETLYQLGAAADTVFIRGIRHVQMEPVFGGKADTAINLRGSCALGLVRMGHPDAMIELADLLADKEPGARVMAARAIGYGQSPDGLPLLRYKALTGDLSADVIGECCASLLKIAPRTSLEFIEKLLNKQDPDSEMAEQIVISIGASRVPSALPLLTRWCDRLLGNDVRVGFVAIATLRCDASVDYLLSQLADASTERALCAIEAIAIYRHDSSIRARAIAVVEKRGERKVIDEAHTTLAP